METTNKGEHFTGSQIRETKKMLREYPTAIGVLMLKKYPIGEFMACEIELGDGDTRIWTSKAFFPRDEGEQYQIESILGKDECINEIGGVWDE